MPDVTLSVKVDGKEIVRHARFDKTGACIGALDGEGRDLLGRGLQARRDLSDANGQAAVDFKMRMGVGCCWVLIGDTWHCVPCN